MKLLVSWIGHADLRGPVREQEGDLGPIAQALGARSFDEVLLLTNNRSAEINRFRDWISARTAAPIELAQLDLEDPTDYGAIYRLVRTTLDERLASSSARTELTFHLSPGTPAMAAIWILLGKTIYDAELLQSSRERGVHSAVVPFDIAAELVPTLLQGRDQALKRLSSEPAIESPEFSDVVHRSEVMRRVITVARRAAARSIPILLEGESGTGKELLARAIFKASLRRSKPFLVLNCGAIPHELVESVLFGHEKGAFTGATERRRGIFEQADGGTLFLDEIGDLPLPAQVKLLRVLQEGEVQRVAAARAIKVDVRIIAATNRDLIADIASGRFREDLFYRLAVVVLKVPPLRERQGDLNLLIDYALNKINDEAKNEPGYVAKKLSVSARNALLRHKWPGNVRELLNTLRRAAIWSDESIVSKEAINESILALPALDHRKDGVLGRALGEHMDLNAILSEVAKHYLTRALQEANGNRTRAAKLVGLASYQTFTNWLQRFGVSQ